MLLLPALWALAAHGQVCRISAAGLNRSRRVIGNVNAECPHPLHTAPFGNWGVTSNFGQRLDGRQFEGWCREHRACDNQGNCTINCRDNWYEWNSCTDDPLFKPPNCTLYNDKDCTQQVTATGVNVLGTVSADIPVSCPVDRNADTVPDEGGCRDVATFSRGTNFMTLYELDPLTGDELVQTLYYPQAAVRLACDSLSCPPTCSDWVRPSSFDSPVSPQRVDAEFAIVVNFGTFVDPSGTCRLVTSSVRSVLAASFSDAAVAPASIVSAFGAGLADTTEAAAGAPLPLTLAGVQVRITDAGGGIHQAPLYFVSPNQVNFVMPDGVAGGQAVVALSRAGAVRATGVAQVADVAPGIFTANADGRGVPAAIAVRARPDGTQSVEPVFQCGSATGSCVPVPLLVGAPNEQLYLVLFGTGIRRGQAVSVLVGGLEAALSYSGPQPSYPGLDQVNVLLPRSLAGRGDVEVRLSADGKEANIVRINVR